MRSISEGVRDLVEAQAVLTEDSTFTANAARCYVVVEASGSKLATLGVLGLLMSPILGKTVVRRQREWTVVVSYEETVASRSCVRLGRHLIRHFAAMAWEVTMVKRKC